MQELKEEVILMQETSLPLVEARKLTFKALRKGRALQCLANVCVTNSLLTSLKRHGKLLGRVVFPHFCVVAVSCELREVWYDR